MPQQINKKILLYIFLFIILGTINNKNLDKFNLPKIETIKSNTNLKNWKLLAKYKNSISNKKLNINLYYKFSKKIPNNYSWYSIKNNNEFIPSFTKKIFKQVSVLF